MSSQQTSKARDPQALKKQNLKLAIVLGSVALAFFAGIIAKYLIFK